MKDKNIKHTYQKNDKNKSKKTKNILKFKKNKIAKLIC